MVKSAVSHSINSGKSILRFDDELLGARVINRPNRFIVVAEFGDQRVRCHIHDPGRLKELIFPGNSIRVRRTTGAKTNFSVLTALEGDEWVLVDSRFHPRIARYFLPVNVESEVPVEGRRIDFRCGNEFIEVKGCTLLEGNIAKFPDAPSERATHHVNLLSKLHSEGFASSLMILVMRRGAEAFAPNEITDPAFSSALYSALDNGVKVFPLKMHLEGKSMVYDGLIPVRKQ